MDTNRKLEFAKYLRDETGCGLMLATKCIDSLIDAIKREPTLPMDVGARLEMNWVKYDLRKRKDEIE